MFDFHEKRKIRRVIYSRYFIGFIFLVTLVIGRSVYERFSVEREMAQKLEDHKENLEAIKARAALLETKVNHLKNERGIEEELRTRFDVARDGEQVVILLDAPQNTEKNSKSPSEDKDSEPKKSFLEMLKFW